MAVKILKLVVVNVEELNALYKNNVVDFYSIIYKVKIWDFFSIAVIFCDKLLLIFVINYCFKIDF